MAAASKILIQLLSLWNLSDRNKIYNAPEVCGVFSSYSANGDARFPYSIVSPRRDEYRAVPYETIEKVKLSLQQALEAYRVVRC
jgi:hypothetical protein